MLVNRPYGLTEYLKNLPLKFDATYRSEHIPDIFRTRS